jgi:hypothetical protein
MCRRLGQVGEVMKVVDPGRVYELSAGNGLVFLQKEGDKLVRNGTTNEEVLEVLIDRVTEAYQTVPCQETIRALYLLREALAEFRARTARRLGARVEGTYQPHDHAPEPGHVSRFRALSLGLDEIDLAPN